MPISTTVEYRYGDDNNGNFVFPSISICPKNINLAFRSQLIKGCKIDNLTGPIMSFVPHAVEECAKANSSLNIEEIMELVNYNINDVVPIIFLGEFKAVGGVVNPKEKTNAFWKPTLDYNFGKYFIKYMRHMIRTPIHQIIHSGMCYTFNGNIQNPLTLDFSFKTKVLNKAFFTFDVSSKLTSNTVDSTL